MVGVWRPRWLRWLDSNQRVRESKSRALPLGDTPIWSNTRDSNPFPQFGRLVCCRLHLCCMVDFPLRLNAVSSPSRGY